MYDNSNPYYVRFNILKLQDLYIVETAKVVYNYIHRPSMLPPSFLNYFNRAHLISQRSSRSTTTHRDLLYIPLLRTKKMQRSIKYQGVKIWNSIPAEIRTTSPVSFKKKIKSTLTATILNLSVLILSRTSSVISASYNQFHETVLVYRKFIS